MQFALTGGAGGSGAEHILESMEMLDVLDPEVGVEVKVRLALCVRLQVKVRPLKAADDLEARVGDAEVA